MIYLDSALINDAQIVEKWGWVKGITTNPTLLAKSERSPAETLQQLAAISPGELYYQLCAADFEGMLTEGRQAFEIVGEKTVLKIPATLTGFRAVACLSSERTAEMPGVPPGIASSIPCAVTAIYSAAQAAIAREAGAKYAIAYVNRATRLLGDGLALVRDMAAVLQGSPTEILAASLKSPEEAAAALQAGAHHLTLPLSVLQAMTTHELSERTVEEFAQSGRGI